MRKRKIILILDNDDPADAILLGTIEAHTIWKRKEARSKKESSDKHWHSVKCEICGRYFGGFSPSNAARSISAHMRQMHSGVQDETT